MEHRNSPRGSASRHEPRYARRHGVVLSQTCQVRVSRLYASIALLLVLLLRLLPPVPPPGCAPASSALLLPSLRHRQAGTRFVLMARAAFKEVGCGLCFGRFLGCGQSLQRGIAR